ncbi:MAG: peptidase M17 [Thermoplasmata archaeon]
MEGDLAKAARVAVRTVLAVDRGERVLIVTNPHEDGQRISRELFDAAAEVGAAPVLITQPVKTQLDFAEEAVLAAIRSAPEVMISISRQKLGKDRVALRRPYRMGKRKYDSAFQYLLAAKKSRAFWSPGVTAEMFARTVPVDYSRMGRDCRALAKLLDGAEAVHIETERGTDILIGLRGRRSHLDDGDFSQPGRGGNLPAGEVFVSPELGASNGRVVFDGSIATDRGELVLRGPVIVEVEGGFVRRISGGSEAKRLREAVARGAAAARRLAEQGRLSDREAERYIANARAIGELGIGLNRAARVVGNILEDEKVYRTCHIAIGSNYDNDGPALIHYDGVINEPTLTAILRSGKERTLLERGELRV